MLYEVGINFIEYVMHISKYEKAYSLSIELESFGQEYAELITRTKELENKLYTVLEEDQVGEFKKCYDEIFIHNSLLVKSKMFQDYSKFLANINFVNNRFDVF